MVVAEPATFSLDHGLDVWRPPATSSLSPAARREVHSWKGKLGKPRGRVRGIVRYASAAVAPDLMAPATSRGESMTIADAEFGRLS